jgi:DNA mismatch endonuclease, patch repair protein
MSVSPNKNRSKKRRPYRPRDPRVVSAAMSAVRSKENRAERILRRTLWLLGHRYRLYDKTLPGNPDLVFHDARVVVFVDGDYWHGRVLIEKGEAGFAAMFRGRNRAWWRQKIGRTIERDVKATAALSSKGWAVVRVWERDILAHPIECALRVSQVIHNRYSLRRA